jgi:hypothetical protein
LQIGKSWSSDGRWIDRGFNVAATANAVLPGFHSVGLSSTFDVPQLDIREVGSTGIPYQRPTATFFSINGQSDVNRAIAVNGFVGLGWRVNPILPVSSLGYGGTFRIVAHPHPSVETQLESSVDYTPHGARYVDSVGTDRFIFGILDARLLSFTLRQQLVLSPTLTIQAYAQLFTAFGRYGPFYSAVSQGAPIRISDLAPTEYASDPSFRSSVLNVNLVVRWEYRIGSTLFLVYTRAQTALPSPSGAPIPTSLLPIGLGPGPTTEVFLVKWSYWWNV